MDDSLAVPDDAKPSWPRALRVALVWVILWSTPVLLLSFWPGSNHAVVKEGIFFSKAASVTFGGPYLEYNAITMNRYKVKSDGPIATGKVKIEIETVMDDPQKRGTSATVTLRVNGQSH